MNRRRGDKIKPIPPLQGSIPPVQPNCGFASASFVAEIKMGRKRRIVVCSVEFLGAVENTPAQIRIRDVVVKSTGNSILHKLSFDEKVSVKAWASEFFAMMGCPVDGEEGDIPAMEL